MLDPPVAAVPPPALVARLRAAGCVYAEDEARLLLAAAASPDELDRLVERRSGGEPVEYVVGWAEFCGRRVVVAPGVFVPRRRTELLARTASALVTAADEIALDLCCGAGPIALVLAGEHPRLTLYAVDIDAVAVDCARRNVPAAQVFLGDLFDPLPPELRGRVDLLTVNAPYVPSGELELMPHEARDYEPAITHDGGPDGLTVHRRVSAAAGQWLRPGGRILFETSRAQAPAVEAMLRAAGLSAHTRYDEELEANVVLAVWSGSSGPLLDQAL